MFSAVKIKGELDRPTLSRLHSSLGSGDNQPVRIRVLICPDKFKGSLTAAQAAEAIAKGWHTARPRDEIDLLPVSDGGDGFGELAGRWLRARPRWLTAVDAAGRPIRARWWWCASRRLAILESARIIGLALLPRGQFHPFALDTTGLGIALRTVTRRGARRVLIGLGGSATNDGGFGLARALGWEFRDTQGDLLTRWTDLHRLHTVRPPSPRPGQPVVVAAVDVQNPLLGRKGATRVYGPQKGLRPADFPLAERCLRRLARVMEHDRARPLATLPGAGAAGGLGFGLVAFTGAALVGGFDWIAQQTRLEHRLQKADLVITGEGSLDRSSLMGKGVGEIARLCRRYRKPCLALVGRFEPWPGAGRWFHQIRALVDIFPQTETTNRAVALLRLLAARVASTWTRSV